MFTEKMYRSFILECFNFQPMARQYRTHRPEWANQNNVATTDVIKKFSTQSVPLYLYKTKVISLNGFSWKFEVETHVIGFCAVTLRFS